MKYSQTPGLMIFLVIKGLSHFESKYQEVPKVKIKLQFVTVPFSVCLFLRFYFICMCGACMYVHTLHAC